MAANNNLYDMWKDFYNQSSNLFDEKVKEDFPAQGVGQALEANLLFKKMINEVTEGYLEQVNMPTRNDLASISSLIINVDAKVDDLEALFEEQKGNRVSQDEFTREISSVKKDIKGLDEKLNQVIALLAAQANKAEIGEKQPAAKAQPSNNTQRAQNTTQKATTEKISQSK
jgi:polyhydroxyalkanoic acid synthase PhaR subunit